MAAPLTAVNLKAFFDANPAKYKSENLQADGYPASNQIANLMTGSYSLVPNPIPQGQVPKPWTAAQLLLALSVPTQGNLVSFLDTIQNCVLRQDVSGIQDIAQLAVNLGKMTTAEQAAVNSILATTMLDPSWPAEVPATCDLIASFTNPNTGQPCTASDFVSLRDVTHSVFTPSPPPASPLSGVWTNVVDQNGLISQALNRPVGRDEQ